MKTPPATPYLLPPDNVVVEGPWTTEDGVPLGERLDHWDPFTQLEIFRTLEVDVDDLRRTCLLDAAAAFAVTVSWHSSRTRLTAEAPPVELGTLRGLLCVPLVLEVPGDAAGGRLDLRTTVILRHAGCTATAISPRREGAVLWTDTTRVALEGGASRFPITAIDFTEVLRLPDRGAWALEWNAEDLEAPVLGGLRLIVNAGDERLLAALRSGSADPRSAVVRSFVMFDVAKTLVHGALRHERFGTDPESFEEGTIGRMLFELLAMCWPGMPVKALVARRRDDPGRLEAELQAYLGVLE